MEGQEALFRGAKGDKGVQGETGETGATRLPFRVAWSIIVLFVVAVAVGGTALVIGQHQIATDDRKWCDTITLLLAQQPPAGSATSNPSRAYEQKLYADFHTLRSRLGCQ